MPFEFRKTMTHSVGSPTTGVPETAVKPVIAVALSVANFLKWLRGPTPHDSESKLGDFIGEEHASSEKHPGSSH